MQFKGDKISTKLQPKPSEASLQMATEKSE
jgi:hypothetical protein